ncbi:MAG: DUF547 domain-containing protein [Pseudolabrys sp.]
MVVRIAAALAFFVFAVAPAAAQNLAARFSKHDAASTETVDHGDWGKLLGSYVRASADGVNRVDYRRFKAQGQRTLDAYLLKLEGVKVTTLSRNEQFAYWANLYNAATVAVVLKHYPVSSIRDIGGSLFAKGPWKMKVVKVEGVDLSLDDIEHNILRPIWRDPRVHYAVNCASIGCPNLLREPFTGEKLGGQLSAAARAYVNHPRGFSVSGGSVKASQIYSWYAADFGGNAAGVLRHARRYARGELANALGQATTISSYDYDWALNDTASR